MLSSLCSGFRRVSRPPPAARHTATQCRPGLEALDGRTLLSDVTGLNIVASPSVDESALNAVAEVASDDVWAVGGMMDPSTGLSQPLPEHFDGTNWSVVPTDPSAPSGSFFTGVAAVASDDVWAVGTGPTHTISGSIAAGPFVEHWDGTSWSIVPTPSLLSAGQFNAVTALATDDVWAVGFTGGHNLIEHWDGTSWSVVTAPAPRNSDLFGISADSSSDVWAVGTAGRSDSAVEVLHWDGTAWSAVTAPTPDFGSYFRSVTALAPDDVWAVGRDPFVSNQALIEHFDGTSWSVIPSPNIGVGDELFGVAAVSAADVWAVGRYIDPNTNVARTLTDHWDGTSWSIIPSPNVTEGDNDNLIGVTALASTGDVVAVGDAPLANGQPNDLILANNEPSGSTPVGPANPGPGNCITDAQVIGTFADLTPDHGKEWHRPA